MIKIQRTDCPPKLNPRPPSTSKAWKKVRGDLWRMQNEKCCYCEKRIPDAGQGEHVEHFKPQGNPEYAELTNEWTNLLLACPSCNGFKLEKFPLDKDGNPLFIDPSDDADDPELHFEYHIELRDVEAGQISAVAGDEKAEVTIREIHLDDVVYHMKSRKEELRKAWKHFVNYSLCETHEREGVRESLKSMTHNKSQYAGMVRFFARKKGISLA